MNISGQGGGIIDGFGDYKGVMVYNIVGSFKVSRTSGSLRNPRKRISIVVVVIKPIFRMLISLEIFQLDGHLHFTHLRNGPADATCPFYASWNPFEGVTRQTKF